MIEIDLMTLLTALFWLGVGITVSHLYHLSDPPVVIEQLVSAHDDGLAIVDIKAWCHERETSALTVQTYFPEESPDRYRSEGAAFAYRATIRQIERRMGRLAQSRSTGPDEAYVLRDASPD